MQDRTILMTGCSSGIGQDAAHQLKARGWRVFATCRSETDCDRLRRDGLESFILDYERPETIRTAVAETLSRTGGTLDALFNNGAYAIPGALEDMPGEALRTIFEANFFGWHDLTRLVLPAMRANGQGRIVQCSSVLGLIGLKWRGAYVASKFALEGYSDVLRLEMAEAGIHVILIEPGPIATRFRVNATTQFEKWIDWEASPRAGQYRKSLLKRLYKPEGRDRFERGPEAVTARLIQALENPKPKPRYFVTTPTHAMGFLRRLLPTRLLDKLLAKG